MRDGRLLPDPIEHAAGYARREFRICAAANRGNLQEPGQPRLHAHPARTDPERWPAGTDAVSIAGAAWWRSERQTFIPVPARRQAVFTILVDVQPLAQAIAPGAQAQRLHDAVESMSPAVLDYRGLGAVREALLGWLAQRARAMA